MCNIEKEWEDTHPGLCYRCFNDIPCLTAQEQDERCHTVLDEIADASQ